MWNDIIIYKCIIIINLLNLFGGEWNPNYLSCLEYNQSTNNIKY